jgi:DNA polymerase II small subunit
LNELNSEKQNQILKKFVDSGINLTPFTLDFISNLNDPIGFTDQIIREVSFIPKFNGHLTKHILKTISNEEIQKALNRLSMKEELTSSYGSLNSKDSPTYLSESSKIISETSDKGQNDNSFPKDFKKIKAETKTTKINFQESSKPRQASEKTTKESLKIKPIESAKSSLVYKPIANEYSFEYEILKDPTGKIYTKGEYDDFYELTIDKFNQLSKLMKNRGDTLSATTINNVLRNTKSQEIAVIGMVNEIRTTKNGNYFLTLEDKTGIVNVIVRKDIEDQEIIKTLARTIMDQMVFVDGTYNPGENGKKGIMFSNNLTKIDIPQDFQPEVSSEPLSITLISDTHIGSKEFEEDLWNRFVMFLKGKIGNKNLRDVAGKIKYLVINGDLIDGIGVYPKQEEDLIIKDLYHQYEKASELLSEIPDYIKIFYSAGNHEPVRNAIPRPAVPKKYVEPLINNGIKCIGNPAVIKTHNVKTLVFHGDSIIDMNQLIPGLDNNNPIETMKELLICRHLAPVFGKKTQIAPVNKDWLVIDEIPDIFHTGHVHIFGMGKYNNVPLVNSGCFQSQTDFMKSFGIHPTPGVVPIIELNTLTPSPIDFKNH